jgi:hypothetical protein
MMKFKFRAKTADGKTVKFDVIEPVSPSASRYAWDRAEKIASKKGYTELEFA